VTGSANDLGMSAGGLVRLVLVLWAARWLQTGVAAAAEFTAGVAEESVAGAAAFAWCWGSPGRLMG